MRARGTLDYSTEAKPGLVITEENHGFVAYRKTRPLSYWLLIGFIVGAGVWFLLITGVIAAVAANDWYHGAGASRVFHALLYARSREAIRGLLVPLGKLALIIPFTVGLACLAFFSAADWRLNVRSNELRITNAKGSLRRHGGDEDIERMRVNWQGLEIRFRGTHPLKRIPWSLTIAKRRDARLLRSMIAKRLGLTVDEKSGWCELATVLKPPVE
jgi:hypothetical protein